jgi:hypothetical protein
MRPVAIRIALTAAALAATAGCLPAIAHADAPHGRLTTAEYNVLLPAYQQLEQLSDATGTTAAQYAQACGMIAPRATHLVATEYRLCNAVARWAGAAERFSGLDTRCPESSSKCLARELHRMETSTRKTATAARTERRVVAARGLTGACRRAFTGSAKTIPALDALSRGLRNMRHALDDADAGKLRDATRQVQRAVKQADSIQDTDSATLLTQCPRA